MMKQEYNKYIVMINRSSNSEIPMSYEKWLEKRIAELEKEVTRLTGVIDAAHDNCVNAYAAITDLPPAIGYDAAIDVAIAIEELTILR